MLERRIAKSTAKQVAEDIGVSASYLSEVIRGSRDPGPKILDALGLEKVVTYRRKR